MFSGDLFRPGIAREIEWLGFNIAFLGQGLHNFLFVASLDRKRLGKKVPTKTSWTRGVFDKEARRKPLAFAADASLAMGFE
jgi:hypothetical protein